MVIRNKETSREDGEDSGALEWEGGWRSSAGDTPAVYPLGGKQELKSELKASLH